MSDVERDSDGFPVSPWHSRFVEIDEARRQDALVRFVEAAAPVVERTEGAFRGLVRAFSDAAEKMRPLFDLLALGQTEAATRRVVRAQRRRRHR